MVKLSPSGSVRVAGGGQLKEVQKGPSGRVFVCSHSGKDFDLGQNRGYDLLVARKCTAESRAGSMITTKMIYQD